MRPKKVRASAMQFAILVATMVAIFLGSFLTLSHTHIFFNKQSRVLLTVIDNSNKAIEYSLKKDNVILDSIVLEEGIFNTKIIRNSWGGYLKIKTQASAKAKSFSKVALTGSKVSDPALGIYLSNDKLPLVLVGNTSIEGDAYVSDRGIKAGIISGHYYNGKELIKGTIKSGKSALPELDPIWLNDLKNLQNYVPFNSDEVIQKETINKNSFFENTKFVYDEARIILHENFIGNIIIKSESEVVITKIAKLTDVVVMAPRIIIEEGFEGSVSLIAKERITLGENSKLNYPSSLIVINTENQEISPIPKGEEPIYISDNAVVEGSLIYLNEGAEKTGGRMTSSPQVAIAPRGEIHGYIYCQGNVELSGTIIGAIYANSFVAREFGSVYINHIYNGKVLGRDIDRAFGGLPFKESNKSIVKWLY